ncbi:MAG: hypothetical protein SO182_08145 [Paludibacteraceae bacterium]|nr:hypothetical protein [Bacteroidales bacterium]MDY4851181.1 hypothetical protein [Paludibacteraceae bacterium]
MEISYFPGVGMLVVCHGNPVDGAAKQTANGAADNVADAKNDDTTASDCHNAA